MKPVNALLAAGGTTIFSVMSALAARHGAINLGQGFPDTEGPRAIVDAAARFLSDQRNQYAPLTGMPELREAVARVNRRFYGLEIDPESEVVVTSGATEGLFVTLAALVNPGDEVVLLEPLYDTYLPALRLLGAIPRLVRLSPPDWALPRDALEAAFGPRTKAILFNSPMNPTGKVFSRAELSAIADLCQRHDAYAICDEVYEHLTFDGHVHVPLMTLPGMRARCLRIGSAGKTFSLTGWKIGYVTASAPLASIVARAHQTVAFSCPPNLQRAVALGLDHEDSYFHDLADTLAGKRDRLARGLARLGFPVLPSRGSYFLTVNIGPAAGDRGAAAGGDVAFCRAMTSEARVAAIPVSAFYGADAPTNLVRFAFCKRDEVLDEALERLAAWRPGTVDVDANAAFA